MDENRKAIESALEFLKEILLDLKDCDYIFLITDLSGIVKYSLSNLAALPAYFQIGTSWSKENIGHTALSLAIKEKKLTHVHCKDHTNPLLKSHFSFAAPFHDGRGKTIGYLVFLGNRAERTDLIRSMLNACVRSIESQIQVQSALKNLEIKNQYEDAIIKSIHDGFLVLKPDCVITHANNKAASLLGVEINKLIGSQLSDIVQSELKVKKVFETGQAIIDEETFVKLPDKIVHIIKTAVPIYDEEGKVSAVIDNFKEIKEVRNLVNQMVGAKASFTFEHIIYKSKEMAETIRLAQSAAKGPLSVLIQGESGTGKELIAHSIHNESTRRNGPFVIIDCASIPRELVESELFGYMEGSFTGARKGGRLGKFELANGGTIFLDEIGEIPLELQAKFLRVLQSHSITRVGGSQSLPVNIRVIAATNRNVEEEVRAGNFREDLFYRLNVLTVNIPSLRTRKEDILVLAQYFLKKYETKLNKKNMQLSPEAIQLLEEYDWPGNVRELENAIVRAVNLSEGLILPRHLPMTLHKGALDRPGIVSIAQQLSYEEMERRTIIEALKSCKGNRVKTARVLGIARSTLYKKMDSFSLKEVQ